MREHLLNECETIYQNCLYTAETHHVLAADSKRLANWLQCAPAVIAATSSAVIVSGVWSDQQAPFAALSAVAASISAVSSAINPTKDYFDHLNAAKNFTALKHDARSLKLTFAAALSDTDLLTQVRALHDRYNDLLKLVPATDDEAFKKAQEKVKRGDHDPDQK